MWNSASTVSSSPTLAAKAIRSPANSPLGSRAPAALHVHEPSGRWLVSSISILRDTGGHATASALAYRTATGLHGDSSAWMQDGNCRHAESPEVDGNHAAGGSEAGEHSRSPGDAGIHLENGASFSLSDATGQDSAVEAGGVDEALITALAAAAANECRCGPFRPLDPQIAAGDQFSVISQSSGGHGHRQAQ